jgi:hypothetical protein
MGAFGERIFHEFEDPEVERATSCCNCGAEFETKQNQQPEQSKEDSCPEK